MEREWICQRCTACCRWPGYVKITDAEVDAMARHLDLSREQFLARHTRMFGGGIGLSLRERADDTCVFLIGNECVVQDVKPQQCRDFPNKWNFPGFERECCALLVERGGAGSDAADDGVEGGME